MKALVTGFIFLMISLGAVAQTTKKVSEVGLTEVHFKKLINQQFSSLITGLSKTALGSFVSLDLKESEVSASGNIINKNGGVWTIKAAGGVSDGLYSVFSNSKFNAKVSLDVQYNALSFFNKRSLSYYDDSFRDYQKKNAQLEYDYAVKKIAIEKRQEKNLYVIEKNKLTGQTTALQKLFDSLSKLAKTPLLTFRLDSIVYEQQVAAKRAEFLDKAITQPDIADALLIDLDNWKTKESKKLKADIEIAGFKFGWFSVGYAVKKNDFKFLDPALIPAEQIKDSNFVSHELRLQYSFYNWSVAANESYYLDAGIALGLSDNFSDLKKTSVQESKELTPLPGERASINTYNAYSGLYSKNLKSVRIYADAYKFFAKNNALAFHVYPELKIKDHIKPVSNLGFGLLFSLKDAKDETAVINTELYYNFLDLFNSLDSSNKLFERNDIGLRFTFPIKFKTNK